MGAVDTQSIDSQLETLYLGYFGRAADGGGLAYWEGQYAMDVQAGNSADTTLNMIAQSFAQSPEAIQQYPFLANPATVVGSQGSAILTLEITNLVTNAYTNLFARTPPAGDAGVQYWVNQLQTGAVTVPDAIIAIANGALGADVTTLNDKIGAATFFTTQTAAANEGLTQPLSPSYVAAAHTAANDVTTDPSTVTTSEAATTAYVASAPSTIIPLTTNVDNVSTAANNASFSAPLGQNSVFGIPQNTLNTGDIITDTGTNGTLNATLTNSGFGGGGTTILASISGVTTYNLTNLNTGGGGGAIVLDGTNLTGVTTINDVGSSIGTHTVVGGNGNALTSAVTTIGISNTTSTLLVNEQAAVLAGSNDAVTINANNVGMINDSAVVGIGDFAANGVENWTVNSAGAAGHTNYLDITTHSNGLVSTASTLTVTGAGAIELGSTNTAYFQSLKTIDATAASGGVTITGHTVNNDDSGLLDGNTALTSAKFGAGPDLLDVSSFTAGEFGALTADGGAGTNTIVLSDAILTGATATTFATTTNFQIFGDAAPSGGTINWSMLPTSANELKFFAAGGEVVTNASSTFTLDAGGFGNTYGPVSVTAAGTGTSDTFHLILGSATGNVGLDQDHGINALTVNGYENVSIVSNGLAGGINFLQENGAADTFTASPGGSEMVTISGTDALQTNAFELIGNGTTITDTDTGVLSMIVNGALVAGTVTDAAAINASASGGLLMQGGDSGFNGIVGDVITGSATHANLLAGSVANDVIMGGTGGDEIATDGGADTITLGAGSHANMVDLFVGLAGQTAGGAAQGPYAAAGASLITDGNDVAQQGFWGNAPGATLDLTTVAGGTGFEGSMSTVNHFVTGAAVASDIVNFSVSQWGAGANSNGLVNGAGTPVAAGADAVVGTQTAGTTVAGNVSLVEITDHTFANAGALATALEGSEHLIFSGLAGGANNSHLLVAYGDTSGNVRIADVDIKGIALDTQNDVVIASDMVQLVGVSSVTSVVAHNVHFVA